MERNNRKNTITIVISVILVAVVIQICSCTTFFSSEAADKFAIDTSDRLCFANNELYNNYKIVGEAKKISEDEYDYEEILKSGQELGYEIFPEKLLCEKAYFFYYYSNVASYRTEIYLECDYTEDNYHAEVERISNIYCKATKKSAVYVEDLFELPVYVITYNYYSKFEYVLLDEENKKIIYVALYNVGSTKNIVFDQKYIPKKLLQESSFPGQLIKRGACSTYFS